MHFYADVLYSVEFEFLNRLLKAWHLKFTIVAACNSLFARLNMRGVKGKIPLDKMSLPFLVPRSR